MLTRGNQRICSLFRSSHVTDVIRATLTMTDEHQSHVHSLLGVADFL